MNTVLEGLLYRRATEKRAFQPLDPGQPMGGMQQQMDPAMAQGGGMPPQPGMDPSMMQGGGMPPQPGMDPAMAQGGGMPQPDPQTGLITDPQTGMMIDPASGLVIDPASGQAFDPQTGEPVDMGGGEQQQEPIIGDMPLGEFKQMVREIVADVITGGKVNGEENADMKSTASGEINEKLDALIQLLGGGAQAAPAGMMGAGAGEPMAMERTAAANGKTDWSLADMILKNAKR